MLYADYIKELEGYSTIETSSGFITYIINGVECYIRDIYIIPEHRSSSVGRWFADEVSRIAKDSGCSVLLGSVVPHFKGCEGRIKALFSYGFTIHSCGSAAIIFKKELL